MASKASKSHKTQMGSTRKVPWEDLPQELLSNISKLIAPNSIDMLSFRSVCKSWYSSSPPIYPFILSVILPLTSDYPARSFDGRFVYRNLGLPMFSVTAIFVIRYPEHETHNWLMFADQLTPGRIMLRQPLSNCYYSLPFNFPEFLDVPNVRVDEISRFYNLSFHSEVNEPPPMWCKYVDKVVLNTDESFAFTLFQTGQVGVINLKTYHFWMAGNWEPVYSISYEADDVGIDDIVNYNGKILGVDRQGKLYDFHLSESSEVIGPSIDGSGTKRKRLVESNGLLYLVVKESVVEGSDGGVTFKVFELDEEVDEWVGVSSIGGRVFLFGVNFSFSISPKELGGSFGKDCIVYIEGSFRDYGKRVDADGEDGNGDGNGVEGGSDAMLFSNLRYGDLRIGVWHMEDPCHCGTIGSYPGCSNVLWPPPTWLWSIDMSKRIGDLEAAFDDILINAPAEKFKAISKELSPLNQVMNMDADANQQDNSEIWSLAHSLKAHLNEARDILKQLETIKTSALSRRELCESTNPQNQVGSSSRRTKELQGSLNSIQNASEHSDSSDEFLCSEVKLNGMILHLEEATTKLKNTLKSRQQPPIDVVE